MVITVVKHFLIKVNNEEEVARNRPLPGEGEKGFAPTMIFTQKIYPHSAEWIEMVKPSWWPSSLRFPEDILSVYRREDETIRTKLCRGFQCPSPSAKTMSCTCTEAVWSGKNSEAWFEEHLEFRKREDLGGWGVFTKKDIKKGSWLGEYFGQLRPISDDDVEKDAKNDYGFMIKLFLKSAKMVPVPEPQILKKRTRTRPVKALRAVAKASEATAQPAVAWEARSLSSDDEAGPGDFLMCLDARYEGNWTRFINHCCDPNVEFRVERVGDGISEALKAVERIPAGTELWCDYGRYYKFPGGGCKCGSPNCKETEKETEKEKSVVEEGEAAEPVPEPKGNKRARNPRPTVGGKAKKAKTKK
ncbi:SET domain-containing protein [Patellaria atrata CBS 101060]|uniref:SET domain-containing protein n=1 Tax=Patellaria atrata CBS 101060 TaxID=1346257 RepID=A0A9P4SBX0_9PEZI|nr:SET domain-containing protein [Patellaria atrata CBS 101060]